MAYNAATVVQKDPVGLDGRVHVVVEFTGNAGEVPARKDYYIDSDTSGVDARRWAINEVTKLNNRRTIADAVTVGQVINLTPIAPVAPTAKQVWQEKVGRYKQYAGAGLTGAGATALAALLTDINATYAAGFLDD